MELKNYQEEASKELLYKSLKLLGKKKGAIVFKSPTGSGKTIVLADFIKRLVQKAEEDRVHALSFVWLAPRALHNQSKKKLEKYYVDTHILECKNYSDLKDRQIGENEILFLNWEGVNKKDNVAIRDNEREDYLEKIIERTIDQGRKVVLIIDESHHSANTLKAKNLIEMLHPRLTIHVSATPMTEGNSEHEKVVIHIEDVKEEEMIKKSLIINEGFDSNLHGEKIKNDFPTTKNLKELILDEALKKRNELAKSLFAEGHNTNPLLLVQLPDKTKEEKEDKVFDEVTAILKIRGITKENGKLSVHLSGNKENIDNIDWDDGKSEVMLFKQAIALGWDCPRAYILVLFREWSSQTFSIQTLGRIMRIPLPEVGYYDDEILNHAYLYTSHEEIKIDEDFRNNEVVLYNSQRKQDYKDIVLPSIYRKQQRDKTRLDPSFIDIFQQEAEKYNLKSRINIKGQEVSRKLIAEQRSKNIDEIASVKGDLDIKEHSLEDLQDYFDDFVRKNIEHITPENRSVARIREAIYKFLQKEFNLHYINPSHLTDEIFEDTDIVKNFSEVISIILSDNNNGFFITSIKNAVESYLNIKVKKEEELIIKEDWEIPEVIGYGSDYKKEQKQKSIMHPFYRHNDSTNIEGEFIADLEKSSKVKWWFKNGDHGSLYFAVPYEDNGNKKLFYVDFIVLLENGKIGLYDTKKGFTLKHTFSLVSPPPSLASRLSLLASLSRPSSRSHILAEIEIPETLPKTRQLTTLDQLLISASPRRMRQRINLQAQLISLLAPSRTRLKCRAIRKTNNNTMIRRM